MKTHTVHLQKQMETGSGKVIYTAVNFMKKPTIQVTAEGKIAKAIEWKMQEKGDGFKIKVDDNFRIVQFWKL